MLSSVLDVFRLRQYFDVLARSRELLEGIRDDLGFLDDARRALVRLPFEGSGAYAHSPFPEPEPLALPGLRGRRLAVIATGGSGALASLVGVARALEEAHVAPSVISVCSGSALFGFPVAAGIPAADVAEFCLALKPERYVDPDWRALATLGPALGRGFAGIIKGDELEWSYRDLLGDLRLRDLRYPAYAPVWNIEHNRLDYLGPVTHPDLAVATAVRMAVSLPLFLAPVPLDGGYWCDGGVVDIFPVRPVLDLEEPSVAALAINGFYPAGFVGEDATGWQDRPASILSVASQVRTAQQVELARVNLVRLEQHLQVVPVAPVPYDRVRGVGFYRQFLSTRDWADWMLAGRAHARRALTAAFGGAEPGTSESGTAVPGGGGTVPGGGDTVPAGAVGAPPNGDRALVEP